MQDDHLFANCYLTCMSSRVQWLCCHPLLASIDPKPLGSSHIDEETAAVSISLPPLAQVHRDFDFSVLPSSLNVQYPCCGVPPAQCNGHMSNSPTVDMLMMVHVDRLFFPLSAQMHCVSFGNDQAYPAEFTWIETPSHCIFPSKGLSRLVRMKWWFFTAWQEM